MKIIFHRLTMSAIVFGVLMFFSYSAHSENIDPLNDDSRWAYGENVGWFNFEPTFGPGVTVADTEVTGYVWQENIGWINLGPMPYGGVVNDGFGNLSGYSWGENVGWISFSCDNTGTCNDVDYKVTIDINGDFNGWAWGENIGWISFSSTSPVAYKVQTSWQPSPTVITLSSFTAVSRAGAVIIIWTTAAEVDNAGFNLYRSESENGEYMKINDSLILAEGSPTEGAMYQFVDKDVQSRTTYFYKLEDIDIYGVSTFHGPVSVMPRRLGRD